MSLRAEIFLPAAQA